MNRHLRQPCAWLLLALGLTHQLPAGASSPCATWLGKSVAGARISAAEWIEPDPEWRTPDTRASVRQPFCRLFARVDGTIGYELWLPAATRWNGRFLGAGVGGSAGTYNFVQLARGVERGFATASTDAGHLTADAHWMLDAAAADNYAHRAVHRMTQTAKAIVGRYYGHGADRSYFTGCSGGGREALKELQRYPEDYDGILAGAPGPNMPLLSVRHMLTGLWQQQSGITIDDAAWSLVQQQAIRSCDAIDGLVDGVVEDPRRCHVDLGALGCVPGQTDGCLSAERLALVRRIVAPVTDRDGQPLDTGLLPGVRSRPGPPPSLVMELFAQGVHHDPTWDAQSFDPAADLAAAYREQPELRADDPDVRAFADRGGKLMIYQGWMDPSVIAQQALDYYAHLVARSGGAAKAARFARLYMVPGMYHCAGGDSTDHFGGESGSVADDPEHDALRALVAWREQGRSPDRLIAAKLKDGQVIRTRPLCAYPKRAAYRGAGSADDAANFDCVAGDLP